MAKKETVDPAFVGLGKETGLWKWRVEKFKIVTWPKEQMDLFMSGDSFIILNSYQVPKISTIYHDIFFWLGKDTTQDEAGTAAYKTVELDDYLGGAPVQHREVEGHESQQFLQLFKHIRYESGGIDTGFKHVGPKEYKPRLFHIKGRRSVRVAQVKLACESLNEGDVFILDAGLTLYQWHGSKCNPNEKRKGSEVANAIKHERGGKPVIKIVEQAETPKEFWDLLGGQGKIKSAEEAGDDIEYEKAKIAEKKLFRLSDESGKLEFKLEAQGKDVNKSLLDTNDVFILDNGSELFVWIGKKATKQEKASGMKYATEYLAKFNRPVYTPISRFLEGGETDLFTQAFN